MRYLDWHVGMKVVFVGTDGMLVTGQVALVEGHVYTLLDMRMVSRGDLVRAAGGDVYSISEDALYIQVIKGLWHHASAFRPVEFRSTDIAIFTAMLTGAKEREPA